MSGRARPGGRPPRGRLGDEQTDPVPLSDALRSVSARLGAGPSELLSVIFGHWEEIVGPALAAHVHPLRLDSESVVVGVDHPAWVTQMRHLAPQILRRVREACPDTDVPSNIEVRVLR